MTPRYWRRGTSHKTMCASMQRPCVCDDLPACCFMPVSSNTLDLPMRTIPNGPRKSHPCHSFLLFDAHPWMSCSSLRLSCGCQIAELPLVATQLRRSGADSHAVRDSQRAEWSSKACPISWHPSLYTEGSAHAPNQVSPRASHGACAANVQQINVLIACSFLPQLPKASVSV